MSVPAYRRGRTKLAFYSYLMDMTSQFESICKSLPTGRRRTEGAEVLASVFTVYRRASMVGYLLKAGTRSLDEVSYVIQCCDEALGEITFLTSITDMWYKYPPKTFVRPKAAHDLINMVKGAPNRKDVEGLLEGDAELEYGKVSGGDESLALATEDCISPKKIKHVNDVLEKLDNELTYIRTDMHDKYKETCRSEIEQPRSDMVLKFMFHFDTLRVLLIGVNDKLNAILKGRAKPIKYAADSISMLGLFDLSSPSFGAFKPSSRSSKTASHRRWQSHRQYGPEYAGGGRVVVPFGRR